MKRQSSEKDKATQAIEKLLKEQQALRDVEAKAKGALPNYNNGKQAKPRVYPLVQTKRIKDNDFIRMYGEGSGPFKTIYPSQNKYKIIRKLVDKFRMWRMEKTNQNYIFHKLRGREKFQKDSGIVKPKPKTQKNTPYQITSLEKLFHQIEKDKEKLKVNNKAMIDELKSIKRKRLKKRMTIYIPRIRFRPAK